MTAPIETAIRHDANTDLIDRLFTATRAFSVGIEPDSPVPDLAAARVSGSEVEILLARQLPETRWGSKTSW